MNGLVMMWMIGGIATFLGVGAWALTGNAWAGAATGLAMPVALIGLGYRACRRERAARRERRGRR